MTAIPLNDWQWLTDSNGQAVLARTADSLSAGRSTLKVQDDLRRDIGADRAAMVMTQIDLRHHAGDKFPDADRLLFTRPGLEQASSAVIASYRAARLPDHDHVIDLCCGIGGDAMALAAHTSHLRLVDRDPVHLLLAEHNVRTVTPHVTITAVEDDVRNIAIGGQDPVFIDPARRSDGGRTGHDGEPPLAWALDLATRAPMVGIKAAPGLPAHLVPPAWERELIALGPDLKEAVLWSPALARASTRATVIVEGSPHSLTPTGGGSVAVGTPESGQWLFDPNPAVTNAGLVQDLARAFGLERIDEQIGFLIGDAPIATPFARAYCILASLPWHEKRVKATLRELGAGPVDIRRRGLAGDIDRLSKSLRGKGDRRILVAMTRVSDAPTAIICDGLPHR